MFAVEYIGSSPTVSEGLGRRFVVRMMVLEGTTSVMSDICIYVSLSVGNPDQVCMMHCMHLCIA